MNNTVDEQNIGHLWYRRARLIEGWSSGDIPDGVRDVESHVRAILNFQLSERGRAVATVHPTLLGELFNAILDSVLVMASPTLLCHMASEPPHHNHDGRTSCKVAWLAENYRAPFI